MSGAAPPAELRARRDEPLADRTSLGLGGPARWLVEARDEDTVRAALAWADGAGLPATVLGGGSNVVVPDAGVDGLVLALGTRGVRTSPAGGDVVHVEAQAGEPWDGLVDRTVDAGLAGLECLAGIPGLVGATPIQNVGAYGVEVAEHVVAVRVLDRAAGAVRVLGPDACGFAYRDSRFKREPGAFVVLSVTFALTRGGAPAVRYAELERAAQETGAASLAEVRDLVRRLRARKSMLLGVPGDPNGRSAGSFFLNPVVPDEDADRLARDATAARLLAGPAELPRWPAGPGRTKLAAGWLVERAGFPKGTRRGAVGVSSRHALALVHHGGGTTAGLLALAEEIAAAVHARFGVRLEREPVLLGAPGGAPAEPGAA